MFSEICLTPVDSNYSMIEKLSMFINEKFQKKKKLHSYHSNQYRFSFIFKTDSGCGGKVFDYDQVRFKK